MAGYLKAHMNVVDDCLRFAKQCGMVNLIDQVNTKLVEIEKYGRYITTATAKFPISGPNFKAKIGFIVDSTTWIGRWKSLTLPIGQNDRLSAKARRLYTWSDGVADIAYWPLCIQHRSGEDISLAQVLTQL